MNSLCYLKREKRGVADPTLLGGVLVLFAVGAGVSCVCLYREPTRHSWKEDRNLNLVLGGFPRGVFSNQDGN